MAGSSIHLSLLAKGIGQVNVILFDITAKQ